jgi:hypothetical protein
MLEDKKTIGVIFDSETLEHINLISILNNNGNRSDLIRNIVSDYLKKESVTVDMACQLLRQRINNKWESIKYITPKKDHAYERKLFLNYWKSSLNKMGVGHEVIKMVIGEDKE